MINQKNTFLIVFETLNAEPVLVGTRKLFQCDRKFEENSILSKCCGTKTCILKAIWNFHTKNTILKVHLFIALLLFCEESDNGVKAILLYKISVILLKNKSSVKALLLYKILVNLF